MYDVKIIHPNGDLGTVTVRESPDIFGREVGRLRNGDTMQVDFVETDDLGDVWAQFKYMDRDRFFALRYKGKVFGTWKEVGATPPTPVIRGYIYRNYEKQDVGWWPSHPPIPDTRPFYGAHPMNNGRVVYTKRLQYFLYNELRGRVPEMSTAEFHKQFRYWTSNKLAFFNSKGSDTNRVWPLGLNLDQPDILNNQLTFGGHTLILLSDQAQKVAGELRYPFRCIDAFDPEIEKYNSHDYPELWVRPSITFGPNNPKQTPFDRFSGRGRMPMILNGTDIAWIAKDKVRILTPDEPTPPQFTEDWAS